MSAPKSRKKLYEECKKKLIDEKARRLTAFKSYSSSLATHISGDDADIANSIEEQDVAVASRERILHELQEIESALARLDDGTYGVCEETEEEIEAERLKLIPWTRLSLEGALIREREEKRRRVNG